MIEEFTLEKFSGEEDFGLYQKLVTDELAMKMNYGRIFTVEEADQLYAFMMERNKASSEYGYFKVMRSTDLEFLGLGAVVLMENSTGVEIEYMLLPKYWGNGYGTGVVSVLLEKIRGNSTIQEVIAITDPDNIASKKILQKYGFHSQKVYETEEGMMAQAFVKNL